MHITRYGRTAFAIISLIGCSLYAADSATSSIVAEALRSPVLEDASLSSHNTILEMVRAADKAADLTFLRLNSHRELKQYQRKLRENWITALGGFPKRTPLHPRITSVVPRQGYRIEKTIIESQPGLFVTGHLFLPEGDKFTAPFPGVLIVCGHSKEGKGIPGYQRAAVLGALKGFAVFIIDPIDQGERWQLPGPRPPITTRGHNNVGVSAILLGWNTATFRIWDAMRALDYMQSRKEIDPKRLGVMGNSGGGTLSSYIMALDDRISSAAPSCYLTTLTDVCERLGPQDAEQNIYGQLAFGLNHAAFVLARAPSPVCMNCTHGDFFWFEGSQRTFDVVSKVFTTIGAPERVAMIDVPGPHGWQEGTRTGSVQWMERWLAGRRSALPLDIEHLRRLSKEYKEAAVDFGLTGENSWVTETGQVRDLPGARSVYDLMRDELDRIEKNRKSLSQGRKRQLVRQVCGIRPLEEIHHRHLVVETKKHQGFTETRQWVDLFTDIRVPSVVLTPDTPTAPPVLLSSMEGKSNLVDQAAALLKAGHPVMAVDITATGEIGTEKFKFYGGNQRDERTSLMLYLLGRSMVELRAEELIISAKILSNQYDQTPVVLKVGTGCAVAGYHAFAAEPELFSKVEILGETPPSWSQVIRDSDRFSFSACVHNALRHYDWIDLYTDPVAAKP